jgi:hypothetical protein
MYRITLDLLCLNSYSEVLPDEKESTETLVGDLIAHVLEDLFGMVPINEITVTCSPLFACQLSYSVLQAQAICSADLREVDSLATVEMRLEGIICCLLLELFGYIFMNEISVCYEGKLAILPRSA